MLNELGNSVCLFVCLRLFITIFNCRELLSHTPGVRLVDDTANNKYPMPMNASESYDVEVGRIRQSLVFGENGLDLFVSGDQLLRGAALNAVLIALAIIERFPSF